MSKILKFFTFFIEDFPCLTYRELDLILYFVTMLFLHFAILPYQYFTTHKKFIVWTEELFFL
ncbi:MAG: hypothetical protein K0S74_193 [Chlamydiales bacterium]|jgi:hypothetical protein|nr:hypothetical protein [Chlamydiales bacterium]